MRTAAWAGITVLVSVVLTKFLLHKLDVGQPWSFIVPTGVAMVAVGVVLYVGHRERQRLRSRAPTG